MKRLILVIIASSGLAGAYAQSVIPDALGGAALGAVIGGVAGGNCHNSFSGNGAAIGAGIGLAAGAILGEVQRQSASTTQPAYYYPVPATYAQPGYGYVYTPAYTYAPAYVAPPPRPNYAVGGTVVGAAAGGLIGAGYHNGWQGAAIGAASGLVVGSIAEVAAQNHEQKLAKAQTAPPPEQPIMVTAPSVPVVYRPAPEMARMHQIADAPRVPDAPTF